MIVKVRDLTTVDMFSFREYNKIMTYELLRCSLSFSSLEADVIAL